MPPAGGLVARAPGLLTRDWGEGLAVVFITASEGTHLVSEAAAGILEQCRAATPVEMLDVDAETLDILLRAGLLQTVA